MPSAIKLVSLPHGLPIVCPHTQAYHHVRPDTAQIKYPISGMFTNVIQLWNADRQHCLAVYLEKKRNVFFNDISEHVERPTQAKKIQPPYKKHIPFSSHLRRC